MGVGVRMGDNRDPLRLVLDPLESLLTNPIFNNPLDSGWHNHRVRGSGAGAGAGDGGISSQASSGLFGDNFSTAIPPNKNPEKAS